MKLPRNPFKRECENKGVNPYAERKYSRKNVRGTKLDINMNVLGR